MTTENLKQARAIAFLVIGLGIGFSFIPTKSNAANYIAIVLLSAALGYYTLKAFFPFGDDADFDSEFGATHKRYVFIGTAVIVLLSLSLWYFRSTKLGSTVVLA